MDVTNTSRQDPGIHLLGSMSGGTDNYITGMEARGQQELVNSSVLPADAKGLKFGGYDQDGWPEFEALGFVKGEPVEGDDLFVNVTLPEGWTRQSSDHAMWSYVHDQRGVKRVAVFYKAAFYDRRAHMRLVNPGRDLAADTIYADDKPLALPAEWPLLTESEKADFRSFCTEYIADAKRYPDIYNSDRGNALFELANA